jgi:hypothetical protein
MENPFDLCFTTEQLALWRRVGVGGGVGGGVGCGDGGGSVLTYEGVGNYFTCLCGEDEVFN